MPDSITKIGLDAFKGTPLARRFKGVVDEAGHAVHSDSRIEGAFQENEGNENVKSAEVKLGTELAEGAFMFCRRLTSVVLPEGIKVNRTNCCKRVAKISGSECATSGSKRATSGSKCTTSGSKRAIRSQIALFGARRSPIALLAALRSRPRVLPIVAGNGALSRSSLAPAELTNKQRFTSKNLSARSDRL